LVLAYSRRLFIQYYPRFCRFEAKHFLREAVRFMDGACPVCIIDDTSVILAAGTGADAVIAPEMHAFARTLGFSFRAHRVGHPDRKGRALRLLIGEIAAPSQRLTVQVVEVVEAAPRQEVPLDIGEGPLDVARARVDLERSQKLAETSRRHRRTITGSLAKGCEQSCRRTFDAGAGDLSHHQARPHRVSPPSIHGAHPRCASFAFLLCSLVRCWLRAIETLVDVPRSKGCFGGSAYGERSESRKG
jgi:hypothetical protein